MPVSLSRDANKLRSKKAPLINLRIEGDKDIVRLRQVGSAVCDALQFSPFARTRSVTAMLELARNALQYSGGGRIALSLAESGGKLALSAKISDQGEGIDALDDIMSGRGFASEGLGLGLRGVKNMADHFDIRTGAEGTQIEVEFKTDFPASNIAQAASSATQMLTHLQEADPSVELAHQNRELLEALAERDMLMREIHHRTRNNLALITGLIRMSRTAAEAPETRQTLAELETRVHSVIKVHELLQRSDSGEALDAIRFLQEVASSAQQAFSGGARNVSVSVRGDDIWIDGAVAVDLGLIVGELITNAFKHAFAEDGQGRIDVVLQRTGAGVVLRVSDNGRGLNEGAKRPERSNSLGWRMIRSVARRHGGNLHVDGGDGLDVLVSFEREIEVLAKE